MPLALSTFSHSTNISVTMPCLQHCQHSDSTKISVTMPCLQRCQHSDSTKISATMPCLQNYQFHTTKTLNFSSMASYQTLNSYFSTLKQKRCKQPCMWVRVYVCACVYECMHKCVYACMCVCVCMHACVCVCMCVCVHACMCMFHNALDELLYVVMSVSLSFLCATIYALHIFV